LLLYNLFLFINMASAKQKKQTKGKKKEADEPLQTALA
jgi:hypothetical protein